MKFLITEPNLYKYDSYLSEKNRFVEVNFKSQNDFNKHLEDNYYNGIFTKIGLALTSSNLVTQKSLDFIASPTTGLNHIDTNYCLEKSIKIISLKDEIDFLESITTTAEHAWMLMLMCGRSSRKMLENTSKYNWERTGLGIEQFSKKTAGIIGFGRLGKILEQYCYSIMHQYLL